MLRPRAVRGISRAWLVVMTTSAIVAGCAASQDGGSPPDEPQANAGTGGAASTASTGSGGSHAAGSTSTGSMGGAQPMGMGGSGTLPPQVAPKGTPADCGIANAAFCETFDTVNDGGRAGPLDEQVWSFARYGVLPFRSRSRLPRRRPRRDLAPRTAGARVSVAVHARTIRRTPRVRSRRALREPGSHPSHRPHGSALRPRLDRAPDAARQPSRSLRDVHVRAGGVEVVDGRARAPARCPIGC